MSKLPKEVKLFKSYPVVLFSRLIINFNSAFSRLISKIKGAAIFPGAVNLACHWSVEIKYPERIQLGQGVVIGKAVTIGGLGGIVIGNNVRISKGATLESAGLDFSGEPPYKHISNSIYVSDGTWIGAGAMILSGVKIGNGAIIGAGTIVTKDVPDNTICVGSPCRLIPR